MSETGPLVRRLRAAEAAVNALSNALWTARSEVEHAVDEGARDRAVVRCLHRADVAYARIRPLLDACAIHGDREQSERDQPGARR